MKELIAHLAARGITLQLNGTNVRIVALGLTAEERAQLITELRTRKAELVEFLSNGITEQGEGYEVAPGVKIHPPTTSAEFLQWRERMLKKPR